MAGRRVQFDASTEDAGEVLRRLLSDEYADPVSRDPDTGRFASAAAETPGNGIQGEQVDQPIETDMDNGARETPPPPADPVADHAALLVGLLTGQPASAGGGR